MRRPDETPQATRPILRNIRAYPHSWVGRKDKLVECVGIWDDGLEEGEHGPGDVKTSNHVTELTTNCVRLIIER